MARGTPLIRNGVLHIEDASRAIPIGSTDWWQWLETETTRAFRFEAGLDSFTARRERRKTGWYWYAYRRCGERLYDEFERVDPPGEGHEPAIIGRDPAVYDGLVSNWDSLRVVCAPLALPVFQQWPNALLHRAGDRAVTT